METTGSYHFKLDQPTVWDLLMNPAVIAGSLPGIDSMTPVEAEPQTWALRAGKALPGGLDRGLIRLAELEPPQQYRLHLTVEGTQRTLSGSALIRLEPDEVDPAHTRLTWTMQAEVPEALEKVLQPLIQMAATMFFGDLARSHRRSLPDPPAAD